MKKWMGLALVLLGAVVILLFMKDLTAPPHTERELKDRVNEQIERRETDELSGVKDSIELSKDILLKETGQQYVTRVSQLNQANKGFKRMTVFLTKKDEQYYISVLQTNITQKTIHSSFINQLPQKMTKKTIKLDDAVVGWSENTLNDSRAVKVNDKYLSLAVKDQVDIKNEVLWYPSVGQAEAELQDLTAEYKLKKKIAPARNITFYIYEHPVSELTDTIVVPIYKQNGGWVTGQAYRWVMDPSIQVKLPVEILNQSYMVKGWINENRASRKGEKVIFTSKSRYKVTKEAAR